MDREPQTPPRGRRFPQPILRLLSGMMLSASVCATPLTVHSAILPDYVISIGPTLDESTGLMIEIAAGALKSADIPVAMAREAPWERAQREAMNEPGAILPMLTRTPARDPDWNWLTVMYDEKLYALTMKGHPHYSSLDDILLAHARVSVTLGTAGESLLRHSGIPLFVSPEMDMNILRLISGQDDVVLVSGMMFRPTVRNMLSGEHRAEFAPQVKNLCLTPIMDVPQWVVVSRYTPAADSQRIKTAFERFKLSPGYREIVKKYETTLVPDEMRPQPCNP